MARKQLFESDTAGSPRIELFFVDTQPAGETGFEVDYIDSGDNVVETVKLTTADLIFLRAVWANPANNFRNFVGGEGSSADTHGVSFTRENRSVWNVLEGATPEYASLSVLQTAQCMAWMVCGETNEAPS